MKTILLLLITLGVLSCTDRSIKIKGRTRSIVFIGETGDTLAKINKEVRNLYINGASRVNISIDTADNWHSEIKLPRTVKTAELIYLGKKDTVTISW